MDPAYLHIVTNHIPIIGLPFALLLLLFGIWRKNDELKAFAFLAFAVLGAATLGVYLLGKGGEDFVEEIAGISHDAIEDHEEMGLVSLIAVAVTSLVALFGLVFYGGLSLLRRRKTDKLLNGDVDSAALPFFPNLLTLTVLGLALISAGILGYTGKLGGKIRHTEFYGGAAAAEEEESGRNRRGRDRKDGQTDTQNAENPPAVEADLDGDDGRGRGRGRGGRN